MKNNELVTTTRPASQVSRKLSTKGIKAYYHSEVKTFNGWLNGREIGPEALTGFFNYIKEPYLKGNVTRQRSASTIQKYRSALQKAVFKYFDKNITLLQQAELSEFFKTLNIRQRGVHRVSRDKTLSKKELKIIQKKAGLKTTLIISALYESGLRISELLNVLLTDCQDHGGYVILTVRKDKRGQERTTVIEKSTYTALRKAYAGDIFLFEGTDPRTKERTGKPLRSETVYKLVRSAGNLINKKISPHTLRHSKATNMLSDGLSIDAVAGHLANQPATCLQFYCHNEMSLHDVSTYNKSQQF